MPFRAASSGGRGIFDPSKLPNLTLFLDERGLTGAPITPWTNQQGAVAAFTATGTHRPATGRTINSVAVANFDGVDDFMGTISTFTTAATAATYHFGILWQADTITSADADPRNNHTLLGDNAGYLWASLKDTGGSTYAVECGHFDGAIKTVSFPISLGVTYWTEWSFDGTRIRMQTNGGTVQTLAAGNVGVGASTLALGCTSFGQFFDGALGSVIGCSAELNPTNITNLLAYEVGVYS
jgi:hypothetical protein